MSNLKIEPEVSEILNKSSIKENILFLPEGQLERKLYEKVNKVIKLAGGVWKTNKKGFLFAEDPSEKLGMALSSGVIIDKKKERQAFYTPEEIAEEVAIIAQVEGKKVLEPSAGDGNLAKACNKFGALFVDCFEIEPSCEENLKKVSNNIVIKDFLKVDASPFYDLIVMNPPFSKGQYHKHVKHALGFLNGSGSIFAIVPDNNCKKLAEMGAEVVKRFSAGSFKESGTNVSTVLIHIKK